MSAPRHRRPRRFHELTRREQKTQYLWLRTLIREKPAEPGARFHAFDDMTPPSGLIDLVFLGRRPPVIYNTTLETTRHAYEARLASSGEVAVYEGWTLSDDYAVGIGLEAVVDAPEITVDVVHAFMDRFLATEQPWRSDAPKTFRR